MARRLDPRAQRVESLERERNMRLFRRTKIRLCTEVKLAVAEREPAAAAHRHVGRLGQFGQPEQRAEEGTRPLFAADGHGDLHMVDGQCEIHPCAMAGFAPQFKRRGASCAQSRRAKAGDRKSVVKGKSVSVRVDLGGSLTINKKHIIISTHSPIPTRSSEPTALFY